MNDFSSIHCLTVITARIHGRNTSFYFPKMSLMNLCQNRRMVILTVVNSFQLRKTLPEPETVELLVRYSENVGIASERS